MAGFEHNNPLVSSDEYTVSLFNPWENPQPLSASLLPSSWNDHAERRFLCVRYQWPIRPFIYYPDHYSSPLVLVPVGQVVQEPNLSDNMARAEYFCRLNDVNLPGPSLLTADMIARTGFCRESILAWQADVFAANFLHTTANDDNTTATQTTAAATTTTDSIHSEGTSLKSCLKSPPKVERPGQSHRHVGFVRGPGLVTDGETGEPIRRVKKDKILFAQRRNLIAMSNELDAHMKKVEEKKKAAAATKIQIPFIRDETAKAAPEKPEEDHASSHVPSTGLRLRNAMIIGLSQKGRLPIPSDKTVRERISAANVKAKGLEKEALEGGWMDFALHCANETDIIKFCANLAAVYEETGFIGTYTGDEEPFANPGDSELSELKPQWYTDVRTAMSGSRSTGA